VAVADDKRRKKAGLGGRKAAADEHAIIAVLLGLDVAELVQAGDDVVAVVGHEQRGGAEFAGDQLGAAIEQGLDAGPGFRGNEEGVGREGAGVREHGRIGGIGLVENGERRLVVGAELAQDFERGGVMLGDVGVGDVEQMNEEIGHDDLLKRGLEGLDEIVGQAADEADRVGHEQLLVVAEQELAGGGIERGEKLVLDEDGRAGEAVEERGLAGVGVADDGGGRHRDAQAARALHAALLHDPGEFALEVGDAVADEAAVLLELRFAFTAEGALAALAGEVGPGAGEARERIFLAGERDLEHGLPGVGALGENLEDDLLPVDDGEVGEFFPVALLSGRKVVVEDDEIGGVGPGLGGEFLRLAAAEEKRRRGLAQGDERGAGDAEAEIFHQLTQLVQQFPSFTRRHLRRLHADQKGAREAGFGFEKFGHGFFPDFKGYAADGGSQTASAGRNRKAPPGCRKVAAAAVVILTGILMKRMPALLLLAAAVLFSRPAPAAGVKPPFAFEPLGVGNGCFVESICLCDRYEELFGADQWVRVLQWGAKEGEMTTTGHAVAVFELNGRLWAWDINFGFLPLDVPPDSREDIARVTPPILARYPGIVPQYPVYFEDSAGQPEEHPPEVLALNIERAFRDATLAGARLAAHRPVNVVQFSYFDAGTEHQSAAAVFIFGGRLCVYFPERGTFPFITPSRSIINLHQLQEAFRHVYPGAFALKSLNTAGPAPVSATLQN